MLIFILLSLSAATIKLTLTPSPISFLPTVKTYKLLSSPSRTLNISNYYNLQYYATLQIGTPGQKTSLIIDTGSSWTWVPSNNCTCHSNLYSFHSNESSSFNGTGSMIVQHYGMGMISGELFIDRLRISSLVVERQDMILVYKDADLEGLVASGLLGLAFNKLSNGKPTVIENLKSQGQIESASFSVYLNNLNTEIKKESALIIGGVDSDYIGGEGVNLNVSNDFGFWIVRIGGSGIGDKRVKGNSFGLVDTGTSLLYVPAAEFGNIFSELNKTGKFLIDKDGFRYFNCGRHEIESHPDIWVTIDSMDFKISAKNYLFYENATCYLFIQKNNGGYWLMGQVFLREYYFLFDMEKVKLTLFPINEKSEVVKGTLEGVIFLVAAFLALAGLAGMVWRKKFEVKDDYKYLPLRS